MCVKQNLIDWATHLIDTLITGTLRMVYGDDSTTGSNANHYTIFTQYGLPYCAEAAQDSAVNYFSLGFSRQTLEPGVEDTPECRTEGQPDDMECMYDVLATGQVAVGLKATENRNWFEELKALLSEYLV